MEALVTGLVDNWPQYLLKHRRLFTIGLCFFMFVCGIPMCAEVKSWYLRINAKQYLICSQYKKLSLIDIYNFQFISFQGGVYLFKILDFYSCSGMSLLWVVFFQTIAIGWFFGAARFCDCVEQMTGSRPNIFFYLCWKFFAPAVMIVSVT